MRRFKVEQTYDPGMDPIDGDVSTLRHSEVINAIGELRRAVQPAEEMSTRITEEFQHQLQEAHKLKTELDQIHEAIHETKREIASLHQNSLRPDKVGRVTDELDAIISDTESATESILHAAEVIDRDASDLSAALKKSGNVDLARDIQEQVIKIFESCNFQDLTGQRITKIVNALRFIDTRVDKMMEIWGGLEEFSNIEIEKIPTAEGDAALLNGPALEGDEGVASQDDIDALFD